MSKKIDANTIYAIITKLIGDINPAGTTHIDGDRIENLEIYIELVGLLTTDLYNLLDKKDDYRKSVKDIGDKAFKYFKNEQILLNEVMEEIQNELAR